MILDWRENLPILIGVNLLSSGVGCNVEIWLWINWQLCTNGSNKAIFKGECRTRTSSNGQQ